MPKSGAYIHELIKTLHLKPTGIQERTQFTSLKKIQIHAKPFRLPSSRELIPFPTNAEDHTTHK